MPSHPLIRWCCVRTWKCCYHLCTFSILLFQCSSLACCSYANWGETRSFILSVSALHLAADEGMLVAWSLPCRLSLFCRSQEFLAFHSLISPHLSPWPYQAVLGIPFVSYLEPLVLAAASESQASLFCAAHSSLWHFSIKFFSSCDSVLSASHRKEQKQFYRPLKERTSLQCRTVKVFLLDLAIGLLTSF